MRNRLLVRAALAAFATATLGACASFGNERAWANGQAMSNSRAYRQTMSGDMSFTTQMKLRSAANPRYMNHRDTPYAPFGRWEY
jgi:hypothetical protein